ncbi:hypothetical protein KUTeg_011241 [Tegillarca granosa]|uniref:Nephrin/kirre n=1 Tax=Tegillarca granosa TaxID=220873 RepID=A0ABQ9F1D8_TEGGR|nr:hypothetical protein KUTeg_011241 [Tegillarca granosa]
MNVLKTLNFSKIISTNVRDSDAFQKAAWTLTGSSEFAVTDESFTLTCNPQDNNAVAIKWRRLDIDTTGTGTSRAIVVANGCTVSPGYDPQYQYTCEPGPVFKLTIPANVMTNSQNSIIWRCESIYGGAELNIKLNGIDEYTVTVAVPVSSVSIQTDNAGNQQVNVIYENTPKTFYCITNGCRPKANVTVTITGVTKGQLTESTIAQNGDLIITRVSQVITANRGGSTAKTIQCSAVNLQGRQPVISQLVTLEVYFNGQQKPKQKNVPSNNPYTTNTSYQFPMGRKHTGVLRCITTPGNPSEITYDWLQNSQVINGQTTDTYTIPTLSNVHNGLRIQCRVFNEYTRQRPPAKVSNITILDVQCKYELFDTPIITLDIAIMAAQEGYNPSRSCSAVGNPTPTVKWYRGSREQTSGTGTSATLVFSNIDRNQADTYQCKATATGKLNFESNPPAVTVNLQNKTENDTNVVFTCNADGFPTNYTYHGWNQYISNILVRTQTDFTGMLSESKRKITITKVTLGDIGRYYCSMENGFHGRKPEVRQQGSSYFDVRASAKFEPKEEARKPGELHKNLAVIIKFYCNPPAVKSAIKWINKTSGSTLTNSDSISLKLTSTVMQRFVYGKVITFTGQAAILTLATLQTFHLARPEPPKNLIVYKTQQDSVSLKWERGYDGGYRQTFVILVQNVESDSVREILINDEPKNNSLSTKVEDLLPSTTYHIKIYAMNENGNSSFLSVLIFVKKTLAGSLSESISGNGQVITTSVIIFILCVVIIVLAIKIWRRGHCISDKENDSKRGDKSEDGPNYEGVSQNYQERNLYEGIQTDQENQSESREVGTYESLESKDVETKKTYESLQTTDRPDSGGISMELKIQKLHYDVLETQKAEIYNRVFVNKATWTLTGSSEFAVAGESFTLTCNPQDSNAVAVLWRRLDIDTTATSRANVETNGCKIGSGSDTQYQYTCEPGPVYKLIIPANVMTNSQNNKVWRCESFFGNGAAAEYKVKVQVPVSIVTIQADDVVNVIYDNIPKTFYCITNGCRPKANVTFTTAGVTEGQFTESTTQNGDLVITRLSQVITDKPIISLDTTDIKVQEGDNLSRPCSAIGNPTPTVKWYRGNIELTSGTGTSATLMFSNIDRNQADTYQCKATTGKMNFEANPPVVTVSLQNTTENATNVVFTCNSADGFLTNYTYHGWYQYIGSTIVRSYTDFTGMLSDNNRKITISKVTFGDIGRYHCVVENGFYGRNPNVLQQGSSYFDVRVSAKFDSKEEAQKPGELHKNVTININFFSNPPALMSGIKWINKTSLRNPLIDSDSTSVKLISTAIQRIVYGTVVTLTGQSAVLTIASLQSFHLGYYQLQIHNGENLSSSFDFQIITSAPPEAPSEFALAEKGIKSVILTWKRGFNGGHAQTFVIRYTNTNTRETKETTIKDTNKNLNYTTEINGLEPSTTYHFWIHSTNEKGDSTMSANLIVQTLKGPKSGGKSEVSHNYEGISQNYQEPNLYEGIKTEVEIYERLESRTDVDVNTKNTHETLQKTERPNSGETAMELYENTKISSGAQKADI